MFVSFAILITKFKPGSIPDFITELIFWNILIILYYNLRNQKISSLRKTKLPDITQYT